MKAFGGKKCWFGHDVGRDRIEKKLRLFLLAGALHLDFFHRSFPKGNVFWFAGSFLFTGGDF